MNMTEPLMTEEQAKEIRDDMPLELSQPGMAGWTVDHSETARKILTYLGYAQEPSLEPGIDRTRDAIAKMIAATAAASPMAVERNEVLPEWDRLSEVQKAALHDVVIMKADYQMIRKILALSTLAGKAVDETGRGE